MSVVVTSWLGDPSEGFAPFGSTRPARCEYIDGAIVLEVAGVEVLSLEMWDDIDWLWPFVVQALDECKRLGVGERYFPSQPLLFRAEWLGSPGLVRISVAGGEIRNSVVGSGQEIYRAVGEAALDFYTHLRAHCSSDPADDEIVSIAASWLGEECTPYPGTSGRPRSSRNQGPDSASNL